MPAPSFLRGHSALVGEATGRTSSGRGSSNVQLFALPHAASSKRPSLPRTYPDITRNLAGDWPTVESLGQTSQSLLRPTAVTESGFVKVEQGCTKPQAVMWIPQPGDSASGQAAPPHTRAAEGREQQRGRGTQLAARTLAPRP